MGLFFFFFKLFCILSVVLATRTAAQGPAANPEAQPATPKELDISGQQVATENQAAPPAEVAEAQALDAKPLGQVDPVQVDPALNQPPTKDELPPQPAPEYPPAFGGTWELHSQNSGVSAMHLQIMPVTNMAIMFDTTVLGQSNIKLNPAQGCRQIKENGNVVAEDCWAHGVEYNTDTGAIRPLKVDTDTWCSSGSLTVEGALVSVGGYKDGAKSVRYLSPCADCEWREYPESLADARWYGTQAILADNRYFVLGGRAAFSFEYMPTEGNKNTAPMFFQFLKDTTDRDENNLYPFVHLNIDGNVYIFANDRSILLNPYNNQIVREYPVLAGGARCYPASGASVLMPLRLDWPAPNTANVMVCGGGPKETYAEAAKKNFIPALDDCNTMEITNPNPVWIREVMPSPRTMFDMLLMPNGHVMIINGAKRGCSAWEYAEDPNFNPVIFTNAQDPTKRFLEMAPSNIARMYHSSSGVLIDGRILVAGSNTHEFYTYDDKYPTELRVEKYSPPYLSPELAPMRPRIDPAGTETQIGYGKPVKIVFSVDSPITRDNLMVTMYSPAFSTHGCNMNQRLIVLEKKDMVPEPAGAYTLTVSSPTTPEIAPAGYHMLFVNNGVVPSVGIWVQLK